jgi:hypothetical protein
VEGPKALRESRLGVPVQSTFWTQFRETKSESLAPKDLTALGRDQQPEGEPKGPVGPGRTWGPDHQGQLTTAPSLHVPKLSMTPVLFNKDVSMASLCQVTGVERGDTALPLWGGWERRAFLQPRLTAARA